MKTVIKFGGISLLVAIGGLFFTEVFSVLMSGLDRYTARILSIGVYSCMTTVICTGVVISYIQKLSRK